MTQDQVGSSAAPCPRWRRARTRLDLPERGVEAMTDSAACPRCGTVVPVPCTVPPEPPVGTWVRDRYDGLSRRTAAGWGLPGFMPFGEWSAMWHARGPLVECGEWGRDQ